jgi:hypothetical protein
MHLIKLASRVGPAPCQYDVARQGQPLEAGIAVDLQYRSRTDDISFST